MKRSCFALAIVIVSGSLLNGAVYADNNYDSAFIRCLNFELLNTGNNVLSNRERADFSAMLEELKRNGVLEKSIDNFLKALNEPVEADSAFLHEGDFVLEIQDRRNPSKVHITKMTLSRTNISYPEESEIEGPVYEMSKEGIIAGYSQICITRRTGFHWLTLIKPDLDNAGGEHPRVRGFEYSRIVSREGTTLFLGEDQSDDISVIGFMYPAGEQPVRIPPDIAECCDRYIEAMRNNDFKTAVSIYARDDEQDFNKRTKQLRAINDITYRTSKLKKTADDFFASIEVYGDGKHFRQFNLSYSEEGVIRIHDID